MTSNSIGTFELPPGRYSAGDRLRGVLAAVALASLVAAGPADPPTVRAEPTASEGQIRGAPTEVDAVRAEKIDSAEDRRSFCNNVRDAATDAHARWQAAEIRQMEAALRKRTAELEARQRDLEAWLAKREAIARKAEENVVTIYGRMRAEAAAVQIAAMTDDMAISILSKLNPRVSSAILNEMEPARAAHLTSSVTGPVLPKTSQN